MKRINTMSLLAGLTAALLILPGSLSAQDQGGQGGSRGNRGQGGPGGQGGGPGGQGRGNWDPAQFQQRMMERVKEQLEITSDDEWKAVEPLVQKVMDARRDQMMSGIGGMMRSMGRGRGGDNGGGGGRGGMFGGEPNPAMDALQKAIDSKASASELKSAMAKVREARKASEDKLKQAQDDLKKVLTTRQEAILVESGMLN